MESAAKLLPFLIFTFEHPWQNVTARYIMKQAISVLRERANRKPLVLIIDDEPAILEVLDMALPIYGIDLKLAPHWMSAVRTYRQHKDQIEAALIDVQMPDCDGPMVLDLLRAENTSLQACFMTGYSEHHSPESLQRISGRPVLEKPFVSLDFVALTLWQMVDESSK